MNPRSEYGSAHSVSVVHPIVQPVTTDLGYTSHATHYVKNSKSIAFLWAVFTVCFVILIVVVFAQPQWIGDTHESKGTGYFGLWKHCVVLKPDTGELICKGRLDDFASIVTPAFRAATVFTGIAVAIAFICLVGMLFFLFMTPVTVFQICGWMQLFSGVCLLVGVLCFPAGWDAPEVRSVCGDSSDFNLGDCTVRWAYVLACIATGDAFILSILAFVLGSRHVRISDALKEDYAMAYNKSIEMSSVYMTDGMSVASSRRSLNGLAVHPQPSVLMYPMEADRHSLYSNRTGRSRYLL